MVRISWFVGFVGIVLMVMEVGFYLKFTGLLLLQAYSNVAFTATNIHVNEIMGDRMRNLAGSL